MNLHELKFHLVDICHCASDRWLTAGSGGNISVRVPGTDRYLCTATGVTFRDTAVEIRACGNQLPEGIDPSGAEHVVSTQAARDQASAEAFNDMFGRYPLSPSDWQTAAVLNPNSYTEKYQGVQPTIKVVQIDPVPGQGVVRTSSFIEQYSVFNRPYDDLGDNRPNSPDFDPENFGNR